MEKQFEIRGKARFDENGRLITPRKKELYNQNLRIVRKVRRSPPILSKKESKALLDDIINALQEITEVN